MLNIWTNKTKQNKNPIISREDYHLTQPCPPEEKNKQTKTQHKSHPNSHKPLDQTYEGRNQKEGKIQPWGFRKGDLKHNKLKKIIMKRQRNTTQMKEQTRNTEVQINEEGNRQTTWKIIQNNDSKDDQKPWKQNGENARINWQRPRRNKHAETNNTITEIKNTLEGINGRISETGEPISELEDKMVEITSKEQNKIKRVKRTYDSLIDLWTISNTPTLEL